MFRRQYSRNGISFSLSPFLSLLLGSGLRVVPIAGAGKDFEFKAPAAVKRWFADALNNLAERRTQTSQRDDQDDPEEGEMGGAKETRGRTSNRSLEAVITDLPPLPIPEAAFDVRYPEKARLGLLLGPGQPYRPDQNVSAFINVQTVRPKDATAKWNSKSQIKVEAGHQILAVDGKRLDDLVFGDRDSAAINVLEEGEVYTQSSDLVKALLKAGKPFTLTFCSMEDLLAAWEQHSSSASSIQASKRPTDLAPPEPKGFVLDTEEEEDRAAAEEPSVLDADELFSPGQASSRTQPDRGTAVPSLDFDSEDVVLVSTSPGLRKSNTGSRKSSSSPDEWVDVPSPPPPAAAAASSSPEETPSKRASNRVKSSSKAETTKGRSAASGLLPLDDPFAVDHPSPERSRFDVDDLFGLGDEPPTTNLSVDAADPFSSGLARSPATTSSSEAPTAAPSGGGGGLFDALFDNESGDAPGQVPDDPFSTSANPFQKPRKEVQKPKVQAKKSLKGSDDPFAVTGDGDDYDDLFGMLK